MSYWCPTITTRSSCNLSYIETTRGKDAPRSIVITAWQPRSHPRHRYSPIRMSLTGVAVGPLVSRTLWSPWFHPKRSTFPPHTGTATKPSGEDLSPRTVGERFPCRGHGICVPISERDWQQTLRRSEWPSFQSHLPAATIERTHLRALPFVASTWSWQIVQAQLDLGAQLSIAAHFQVFQLGADGYDDAAE